MTVTYEQPVKTMSCITCHKDVTVKVVDGEYQPAEAFGKWRRWFGPQCGKCVTDGKPYG